MDRNWELQIIGDDIVSTRIFSKVLSGVLPVQVEKFVSFSFDLIPAKGVYSLIDFREHSELRSKCLSGDFTRERLDYTWIWGPDDAFYKREFFKQGFLTYFGHDFNPLELRAAVVGMMRKYELQGGLTGTVLPSNFRLDSSMQQVYFEGNSCALSTTEFRIFVTLLESGSAHVTRDEIRDRVWGTNFNITVRSIDSHISRMRRKLPENLLRIESDRNNGYNLKLL